VLFRSHRQPAFPGRRPRLKAAESFAAEILSIPIYPELSEADQDRVIEVIHAFRS
jgi:dTDP-4-amino-4,6-dideoxygalactose transaminase